MAPKRQRVAIERPEVGQAALPVVCYLPSFGTEGNNGGKDAEPSTMAESVAKRLKYHVHAKARQGANVQLVHASLGDIDYVGRSDGIENAGIQPCSYVLGVYQPGEGKLQLVNVASDRLFRLDTRLAGLVYEATGQGAELTTKDERKEAAKRLVDEFGSTRRRRQLTAREAGLVSAEKISGGSAVQDLLGSVATKGEGEGLTREEVQRRAFAQRTIPPHNPNATTAADAYPLRLLLAKAQPAGGAGGGSPADLTGDLNVAQMYKLAEDAEELAKAREKEWVSPYVLSRLGALRNLKSSGATLSRSKQMARQLALLAALLRLMSRPVLSVKAEGMAGLARDMRLREGLLELLLDRFYVRTEDPLRGVRYERTDAQKQLLLSYILAVAVTAENGFLDVEQFEVLRAELKMEAGKLVLALQQLGCTTKVAKVKVEQGGQVSMSSSHTVSLLMDSKGGKTLQQCFPAIKVAKGKGKGGGR